VISEHRTWQSCLISVFLSFVSPQLTCAQASAQTRYINHFLNTGSTFDKAQDLFKKFLTSPCVEFSVLYTPSPVWSESDQTDWTLIGFQWVWAHSDESELSLIRVRAQSEPSPMGLTHFFGWTKFNAEEGIEPMTSASRSGPVPVLSPSGFEPGTEPVPESFRNQGPRTRIAKNRKKRSKPVTTGPVTNTLKWGIYRQKPGMVCKNIF
jgi:hypothetical protein